MVPPGLNAQSLTKLSLAPEPSSFEPLNVIFQVGLSFLSKKVSPFFREAKKDQRLKESGDLIAFNYDGEDWPLMPPTVFYDWLYCSALQQNQSQAKALLEYDAFTDIEFNPNKSINCQAASAAIYKSLTDKDLIDDAMKSHKSFINIHKKFFTENIMTQDTLRF